jgi:trimeric autotransporter adhesin
MKTSIPPVLITFALVCFAVAQNTQAVSPAPDGGYPGGNTAEGQNSLLSLSSGTYNAAVGIYSLLSLSDGNFCTGIGAGTLLANTADQNTATGAGALLSNTTGGTNTANGAFALFSNTEGSFNVANGDSALFSNTTGTANIALGYNSGFHLTTGGNNIDIGNNGHAAKSDTIRIGTGQTRTFIAGISGATVTGTPVVVNANGQLGVAPSSQRFKDEIKPMDQASEALFALKPVTFRYKKELDPAGTPQLGLVAEEVEKVNPDLVVRDEEGKPYSVRYDQVNAMLLNEFLKAHLQIEEQGTMIAQQQKQIEALTAGLQKVSAQVQVSKPARQTVLSNQ